MFPASRLSPAVLAYAVAAADCRSRRPASIALAKITDKAKRARKRGRQIPPRNRMEPFSASRLARLGCCHLRRCPSLHERNRPLDGGVYREKAGVQQGGIVGLCQRRDASRGVAQVARANVGEHAVEAYLRSA